MGGLEECRVVTWNDARTAGVVSRASRGEEQNESFNPVAVDIEGNVATLVIVEESSPRWTRWLQVVPWTTLAWMVAYISIFYSGAYFETLALDTDRPRVAYTWLTYSWFHLNSIHLWINMFTFLIFYGLYEVENGFLRALAVLHLGIVNGAFGILWQRRFFSGVENTLVIGVSGGIYAMLASQIGFLSLNWPDLSVMQRVVHTSLLASCVTSDIVVNVLYYNRVVSYSAHVGGFVIGVFSGLCASKVGDPLETYKTHTRHRRIKIVRLVSGILGAVVFTSGFIDALIPY